MTEREQYLKSALEKLFGYKEFLPLQLEALHSVRFGRRDVFVNFATGGGKSLIYQLPAYTYKQGVTVVVSPLIALINDQVRNLKAKNRAAYPLHGQLHPSVRRQVLEAVSRDQVRLLFVSPEQFHRSDTMEALGSVSVNLFAVDEAHCASMWGHDFRPSYGQLKRHINALGRPRIVAVTATASALVRQDAIRMLGIDNPEVIVGDVDRPNLNLSISQVWYRGDRDKEFFRELRICRPSSNNQTIVYYSSVELLLEHAIQLENMGFSPVRYYGDMNAEERRVASERFEKTGLMLATSAFGMGVDRPHIRQIFHVGAPFSIEDYWQQVGRAGRDGEPAYCKMFTSNGDSVVSQHFLRSYNPSLEYIKSAFKRLWAKALPGSNQIELHVPTYINGMSGATNGSDGNDYVRRQMMATFATLQEFNAIEISGKTIRLLLRPDQLVEEGGLTEDFLNAKYASHVKRHRIISYFASEFHGEPSANIRKAILDHFRDDSLTGQAETWEVRFQAEVDRRMTGAILLALERRDMRGTSIAHFLQHPDAKQEGSGALTGVPTLVIDSWVQRLASMAVIRPLALGPNCVYSITEKGQDTLRSILPDVELTRAPQDYLHLKQLFHHPVAKNILQPVIEQWVDGNTQTDRFCRDPFMTICQRFLGAELVILGKTVVGADFVRDFMQLQLTGRKARVVKATDAYNVLNMLTENSFSLRFKR